MGAVSSYSMLFNFKLQLEFLLQECVDEIIPPEGDPMKGMSAPIPVLIEVPLDKKHGDYSCSVALRLASIRKKNPLELASLLKDAVHLKLQNTPLHNKIQSIEVVKPGFINFHLGRAAILEILQEILQAGENFGRSNQGLMRNADSRYSKEHSYEEILRFAQNDGKICHKVQIEFLSANPTGPLSVAHARQAAVGDALGNILKFLGYDVFKEYYVNDEGNQINILGRSIELRAREILGETVSFPEDGYQGDYIREMAQIFMDQNKITTIDELNGKELSDFSQFGVDYLMAVIKKELDDFGVTFDVWSYQSKIAPVDTIENVLKFLRKKGDIYDHEGAVWFKSTAFGDDKDRVVRKSDGSYTYLTPDIVYHKNKFERGFQKVINIWGPDHHGYIPRLKAAVEALGYDPQGLEVLIVQLATIFHDGKPLSMSTRRGQYISLREVLSEVGKDAARFFFLMRHIKAHLEFDLELAKKETPENPVYYIQYAHARIHSILGVAKGLNLKPMTQGFHLLKEEEEFDLIKKIWNFPDVLSICNYQLDPYLLTCYLLELATVFHKFYDRHRVVDAQNPALSAERLALINATRIVLANGLNILGVSAPQKM